MDVLDGEAGETGNAHLAGEQDAGEHAGRDEQVRDDAARAGGVPDRRRRRLDAYRRLRALRPAAGEDDLGLGEEPALQTLAIEPGRSVVAEQERRLGGDVGGEARGGADGDACQRTSAGRPVAGSIRWWARSPPSRSHDRVVMPLVASAPESSVTVSPAGSATTSSPRVARSPPAETKPSPSSSARASSTARPLTTPLRSSRRPTGRGRGGRRAGSRASGPRERHCRAGRARSPKRCGRSPPTRVRRQSSGRRGRRSPGRRAARRRGRSRGGERR